MKFDTEPIPADILNRDVADTLKAGSSWHWGYQAVFSYDAPSRMKQVSCPVLLVCGRRDPTLRFHKQAVEGLPDAKVYLGEDHGVYFLETGADEFAPVYLDFINSAAKSS